CVGVVATDVVVGAVDGRASVVGGWCFRAAPAGAALLASAVARGVATDRSPVGTGDAVAFAAIGILGARRAEPRLPRNDAFARSVTCTRAGLAGRALGLIERCAFDAGTTLAEPGTVLLKLGLVVAATLGAAGAGELAARLVVRGWRAGADRAGRCACRAEFPAPGVTTHAVDTEA